MNNSEDTCCLCLSVSNIPYKDLFSNSGNNLTYYDEISLCLAQLAEVLKKIAGSSLKLCCKCCATIQMVYEFNRSSLNNVSIFSAQNKDMEGSLEETQSSHVTASSDVEQKDGKEMFLLETEMDLTSEIEYLDSPINDDLEDADNTVDNKTVILIVKDELDSTSLEKIEKGQNLNQTPKVKKVKKEKAEPKSTPEKKKIRIRKRTLINREKREKRKLEKLNEVHICKTCNKTFKERPYLLQHQKIHLGVKRYMCDVCGKSFQQKHHLKNHITTHTDNKPFMCDLCSKTFKHKESLEAHKVIHKDEKPYACDLCGKTFKTYRSLSQHKLYHSGVRAFPCSMCDKAFITKSQCNAHMRTHTGEKAFTCEICNKSFIHHNSYYQHKLLHTGKRRYSCDNCGKAYVQAGGLYKHKRKCVKPIRVLQGGGEIFSKTEPLLAPNQDTSADTL